MNKYFHLERNASQLPSFSRKKRKLKSQK